MDNIPDVDVAEEVDEDLPLLLWTYTEQERQRIERGFLTLLSGWFLELGQFYLANMDSGNIRELFRAEIQRQKPIWRMRMVAQWESTFPPLALGAQSSLASAAGLPVPADTPSSGIPTTAIEERADKILDTTEERWLQDPLPSYADELAQRMRDDLTQREKIIAEVEAVSMTETAKQWAADSLGAENFQKTWLTEDDDKVRRSHAKQHRMTVGANEVFPNGQMFPGDTNAPASEYINCRCSMWVTPIKKED